MREPDEPDNMNEPKSNDDPRCQNDLRFGRQSPADDGLNLAPDLQALEAAWGQLRPSAPQIDRDRLMYQAGWTAAESAAAQRHGSLPRLAWPVALGGMTAVAATLLGMLLVRPEPGIVERVVYIQRGTEEISTDAARAFAQSNAGASAADGAEPSVWTVGHFLRASAAGSSQLASDLLPADSATPPVYGNPPEEPMALSSRSFDFLLEEVARGDGRPVSPDRRLPAAQESSHDL